MWLLEQVPGAWECLGEVNRQRAQGVFKRAEDRESVATMLEIGLRVEGLKVSAAERLASSDTPTLVHAARQS